jgi:hypothetical protein
VARGASRRTGQNQCQLEMEQGIAMQRPYLEELEYLDGAWRFSQK